MALLTVLPKCTGMARFLVEVENRLGEAPFDILQSSHPSSSEEMLEAEGRWRAAALDLADLLVARDIVKAHLDDGLVREAMAERRNRYREEGHLGQIKTDERRVTVQLAGGLRLRLWTKYMRPTRKGLVGRPRGSGKRREGGAGAYPLLERLGIADGVTALTCSDISRQTVLCSSYDEAREQLQRAGLDIDISTLVRVAVATGANALKVRDHALARAREVPLPDRSPIAGRRIRVSVDGGRARTRRTHKRARKGKNGRRPFTLEWKEPRLVTVDVLDNEGEMDRTWRPIYEVSLGNADEVFALLTGLLRLLGVNQAAQVVFVSDGAEWIWNRVEQLIEDAEIPKDRVRLVLDYYHATEHLWDALHACRNLKAKERTALFEKLRRLLLEPEGPRMVIDHLRMLARGRRGRKVNKEIRYLEGHLEHLRYAEFKAQKVPIGSGVVESAVRRVLNLRFKAASMCWRPDHLAPLLYLRAILKSGRWDDLMLAQLNGRHWITPEQGPHSTDQIALREVA